MPISVHVLVLNSSRPLLRFASVSRKNGMSTFEYCGWVGIGCDTVETFTFGPAPSPDCDRTGAAAMATTTRARAAARPIRRMKASLTVIERKPGLVVRRD